MKRIHGMLSFLLFAGIFLAGCGGGGGGAGSNDSASALSPVTVPSESLHGTYVMSGFLLKYSNGTSITEKSPSINNISGSMKIVSSSWTQNVSLNGVSGGGTGTVSITWTTADHTAGTADVSYPDGSKDNFELFIDGYRLTVYACASDSLGDTVEEWDYWEKVLDTAAPVREEMRPVADGGNGSAGGFPLSPIGSMLEP